MSKSSLSSVVSNIVRASMGTSVSNTVTDEDLDRHIAELILKEAKQKAEGYGKEGIRAYLPAVTDPNVPRPNKQFLSSIIRSTDNHNKTLLRAQALAAQEIKREREEQERQDRRARAEEAAAAERIRRLMGGGRRAARDGERDRDRRRGRGWERDRSRSRERVGESRRERSRKGERRERSWERQNNESEEVYTRDKDRRRSRRHRSPSTKEQGSSSSPRRTSRDRDPSPDAGTKRRRRRERHHDSHSRTHRSRRRSSRSASPRRHRPRTPTDAAPQDDRKSHKRSRSSSTLSDREEFKIPKLSRRSHHSRSPSPVSSRKHKPLSPSSSQTPLSHSPSRSPSSLPPSKLSQVNSSRGSAKTDMLPPPPASSPPPLPAPPSKMDKYFEPTYDPRLDTAPLVVPSVPANGLITDAAFEGWDLMLEVLKARREEKAERKRMERMGLTKEQIKKSKKKDASTLEVPESGGESIMDIEYKKRGTVREWDLGKEGF